MLLKKIPQSKVNTISFLFGNISDDLTYKTIEDYAINHNLTFEKATLDYFKFLIESFKTSKDNSNNYFESLYKHCTKNNVYLPEILYDTYTENKNKYPKVLLTNNYVLDKKTNEKFLSSDNKLLTYFGKTLGEDIGFEYLKYELN